MQPRKWIQRFLKLRASDASVAAAMRRDWDARAREDARYYVATLKQEWSDADFFESGRIWVDLYVVPDLQLISQSRPAAQMRIVEIGCGAGRMTRNLSEIFGAIDAVDISAEMISRARETLRDRPNVRFHVTNGRDLSGFGAAEFDFAFSAIVFQHVPRKSIVAGYLREVHRVLREDCIFKFQVQGCPIEEESLNTWVGVGFSSEEMQDLARRIGFAIHAEAGAGTQEYWLTFIKKG